MNRKRKRREFKEPQNQPQKKKRKIKNVQNVQNVQNIKKNIDHLVISLSMIEYERRLYDIFCNIFEQFTYDDISFVKNESKYLKMEFIIHEFCNLLLQSKGSFQISENIIFLFEDKRFCIPFYFLFPSELEFSIQLIQTMDLNKKFGGTQLFETSCVNQKIRLNTRVDLLYSFLRYMYQEIKNYFVNNKMKKEEKFQYKIILSKKMLTICKDLQDKYALDLTNNIDMFKLIIREAKSEYKKL